MASQGATQPLFVNHLADNDVLLGRGTGPNEHVGNQTFREFVDLRRTAYLSAETVEEQQQVFVSVIALVHNSGGRFLKKVGKLPAKISAVGKQQVMIYEVITDTKILLYKIKQAFRYSKEKKPPSDKRASLEEDDVANVAAMQGSPSKPSSSGPLAAPTTPAAQASTLAPIQPRAGALAGSGPSPSDILSNLLALHSPRPTQMNAETASVIQNHQISPATQAAQRPPFLSAVPSSQPTTSSFAIPSSVLTNPLLSTTLLQASSNTNRLLPRNSATELVRILQDEGLLPAPVATPAPQQTAEALLLSGLLGALLGQAAVAPTTHIGQTLSGAVATAAQTPMQNHGAADPPGRMSSDASGRTGLVPAATSPSATTTVAPKQQAQQIATTTTLSSSPPAFPLAPNTNTQSSATGSASGSLQQKDVAGRNASDQNPSPTVATAASRSHDRHEVAEDALNCPARSSNQVTFASNRVGRRRNSTSRALRRQRKEEARLAFVKKFLAKVISQKKEQQQADLVDDQGELISARG